MRKPLMPLFDPITRWMMAAIYRTCVQIIAVKRGIFAIHFFRDDDGLAFKMARIKAKHIILTGSR